MQINHIKHIKKKDAKGKLNEIYKDIILNFGKLVEPFALHSINEKLIAGVWAMLYETMLIDTNIDRKTKENIAICISEINKCQYCADAHSIMAYNKSGQFKSKEPTISNEKDNQLNLWSLNNHGFNSFIVVNPPFTKNEAPEIIGTSVLFHYINRMVSLFANNTPFPISGMKNIFVYISANFIFNKAILRKKTKGKSLEFIEDKIIDNSFKWAEKNIEIQKSFQYFKHQTELEISNILSKELILNMKDISNDLSLLKNSFGNKELDSFLEKITLSGKEIARYCFLIMFDIHKIQEKDIASLKLKYSDKELMQISAYSSLIIAEKIGDKLYSFV